jgi:hypothetical protein
MMRDLLITFLLSYRNSQPLNLAASYLVKLGLPALSWLGDEEQDQAVPCLTEPILE